MKLYETLAEEIANSIQSGTFRRGDRLPSVRQLSENRGISTATVYAAYYLLESRGLVEAQERSGYFVTGGHENFPPEVETVTAPGSNCNNVAVNELVFQILESARARDIVPLRVSLSQSSGLSMARVGALHSLFAIEGGPLALSGRPCRLQ